MSEVIFKKETFCETFNYLSKVTYLVNVKDRTPPKKKERKKHTRMLTKFIVAIFS